MPIIQRNTNFLTFDSVYLEPQFSSIKSRIDVDLTTKLTSNIVLKHPVIPTNMSTITELDMMVMLSLSGGTAFLHRFMPYDKIIDIIRQAKSRSVNPIAISIGVKDEDYDLIDYFNEHPEDQPHVVLLDIAHGHSQFVIEMIHYIKNKPSIKFDVIAGNVATAQGYTDLVNAGANAVRVGVSGGSVCTTKLATGHHIPTLQSVYECYNVKHNNVPIIADGGIKTSGDIVKCLAAGADSVCAGGIFAGSSLTPGEIINGHKQYYGMSSEEAQKTHRGGLRKGIAPEGKAITVPYTGESIEILERMLGGVRSGLTYSGSKNIAELQKKAILRTF